MKKSNHLLKVTCIMAMCTLFITGCAQAPPYQGPMEPQHAALLFHPETTYQTMTGFGAGFNTSEWINKISNPQDWARAYDLLYGPQYNGVRLNIVRLVISNTAQELPQSSPLYAQGFKYDWGGDDITQSMWSAIQPIRNRIKPIIYAVPFTPPAKWKDNNSPFNGGRLKPKHYQEYAEYLADFVDYYHKILHVDIDVLSIQNEPGVAVYWASCIWSGEEMRDFLKILTPLIRARGLNTRMMSSEGTAWSGAWAHLEPTLLDPEALPMLGIMASHSYLLLSDPAREKFATASEQYKLPVWMSEMSLIYASPSEYDDPTMKAALSIADYIYRDIYIGRASAWIYCFAIFKYNFNGSMGVLSPADKPGQEGELIIPKRFWAMANYSQFVRPRWKVMKVEGSIGAVPISKTNTTGFVSPLGDGFVIVAFNPSDVSKKVTYSFGNWSIDPTIDSYCTSDDYDLAHNVLTLKQATHYFTTTLPPKSVITFKGKLIKPKVMQPHAGDVIIKPGSVSCAKKDIYGNCLEDIEE